eukprot:jgi/Tetstr1/430903/TSEL_020659.t1
MRACIADVEAALREAPADIEWPELVATTASRYTATVREAWGALRVATTCHLGQRCTDAREMERVTVGGYAGIAKGADGIPGPG